jgi:hypothetical protein
MGLAIMSAAYDSDFIDTVIRKVAPNSVAHPPHSHHRRRRAVTGSLVRSVRCPHSPAMRAQVDGGRDRQSYDTPSFGGARPPIPPDG